MNLTDPDTYVVTIGGDEFATKAHSHEDALRYAVGYTDLPVGEHMAKTFCERWDEKRVWKFVVERVPRVTQMEPA